MKQLLKSYILAVTLVLSLTIVLCGSSLAKRRTEQVMEGSHAAVFVLQQPQRRLAVALSEGETPPAFLQLPQPKTILYLAVLTEFGAAAAAVWLMCGG